MQPITTEFMTHQDVINAALNSLSLDQDDDLHSEVTCDDVDLHIGRTDCNCDAGIKPENISVLTWTHTRIPERILIDAHWNRTKASKPVYLHEPKEYVDSETGEILTKAQVRKYVTPLRAPSESMRMLKTQAALRQFDKGDVEGDRLMFVSYILKLRSSRGGLICDLRTALDRWIDHNHANINSTDRARKRKSLEKLLFDRGIMATNQSMTKDLQVCGDSTKTDRIGEPSRFVYALKAKPKAGWV